MPPETVRDIADRALTAATKAELAAAIAKVEAEGIRTEMRERFKMVEDSFAKQDRDSLSFRSWLKEQFDQHRAEFRVFDTEFRDMNARCKGHDEVIFGSEEKNIVGVIPKVETHDSWINRFLWTWGLITVLSGAFIWWFVYFYGDAMKRGVFQPTAEERDRAINMQVSKWLPNQRWPSTPPPPDKPNG